MLELPVGGDTALGVLYTSEETLHEGRMQDPSYFPWSNAKECISSAVPQTWILSGEQHGSQRAYYWNYYNTYYVLLPRDTCLIMDTVCVLLHASGV